MSRENVEVVRRANAALNEADWDTARELFHPDVEFCDLRPAPDLPQIVRGIDGLGAVLAQWSDAYDEFGVEAYEYVDAEPWVIVDVRWHGRGKGSSVPLADMRQADACKVLDGKIVALTTAYDDVASALAAVRPDS